MKNTIKFFGIIAVVAMIGFSMTSCDNGGGGGSGDPGPAFLGSTLELSGWVYVREWDEDDDSYDLVRYDGTRAITSAGFETDYAWAFFDVDGEITEGQLSLSIGMPPSSAMVDIGDFFSWKDSFFTNFNISNRAARITVIQYIWAVDEWEYIRIRRERSTPTVWENVLFIYVNTDVSITGGARTTPRECKCEEWDDNCYCEELWGFCRCALSIITQPINLSLRAGWNAVHERQEVLSAGLRVTISTGNPANIRWIETD